MRNGADTGGVRPIMGRRGDKLWARREEGTWGGGVKFESETQVTNCYLLWESNYGCCGSNREGKKKKKSDGGFQL